MHNESNLLKETHLPNPHTRCTKHKTGRAKTIIKLSHILYPVNTNDWLKKQNRLTILEIVHKYDKLTSELK